MNRSAFSLIELSLSILVISLLITIAMGGQSLLTQSRISRLAVEINTIKQAIAGFELTYNAIPGDMSDAYLLFSASGCGDDGSGALSTEEKQSGCNGDGDHDIVNNGITISGAGGSSNGFFREEHNVWNHLSYAELLTIEDSTTNYFESKAFADLTISYSSYDLTNNPAFKRSKNVLFIGKLRSDLITSDVTQTYATPGNILSPQIARKLDNKLDDALAYSGNIQGFSGYDDASNVGVNCSSPVTDYNQESSTDYLLTNTTNECVIMIDIYTIN